MVIGSPMCTAYSPWQNLNNLRRDPDVIARERTRALLHLKFCCELYEAQRKSGRYFIHEHLHGAASWSESCMQDLIGKPGVVEAVADLCQYGLEAPHNNKYDHDPIKKPTRFLTSSRCIQEALSRRCHIGSRE